MLIILLGVTLTAFAIGQLLSATPRLPPAALLHLVFAVGIMPLILGSLDWGWLLALLGLGQFLVAAGGAFSPKAH